MTAALELFALGEREIGRVIAGQNEAIAQALITLLCGGHALIEGVPGVAKTLAVKTLSRFLGLDFRRAQGTPDMMPADLLGTNVFSPNTSESSLHKGPVFTQFLLADEINRMPPRTQAALLECMEERQVTMDGDAHKLDEYFTVFATQKPLEFAVAYPRHPENPRPLPRARRRAHRTRAPPRRNRSLRRRRHTHRPGSFRASVA